MGPKVFAGIVALAFFYIISPLIFPIAMGGVLAVLLTPSLEYLERHKFSTTLGSALLTLGITIVLILPMSFLIFFAAKTGFYQFQFWGNSPVKGNGLVDSVIQIPSIHQFMVWVTSKVPVGMSELSEALQELGRSIGLKVAEVLGGILGHLPGLAVSLGIIVVSVYFFLVDGRKLTQFFRENSFFTPHQTDRLIGATADMCRSVILASLVSGIVQSLLEALACMVTGTPNVALIGLFVFIGSFIPLVGSTPITLVVGVQQLIEGRQQEGIVLLIVAFILLGVDNAVRPLFLKGSTNLHPFIAFLAAFGGLQTWGFLGVFLGPIVAALFVVVLQIIVRDGLQKKEIS